MLKTKIKIFKSIVTEALIIALSAFILSLIGNKVSPVGIPIFPDLKEEMMLKKLFKEIESDKLFEILEKDNAILIDARSKKSFLKSHIPTSINIPYKEADKYYDDTIAFIPKETPLIIYCNSVDCSLSMRLAKKFKGWDFDNIRILKGGFDEWIKKEFKVETGE